MSVSENGVPRTVRAPRVPPAGLWRRAAAGIPTVAWLTLMWVALWGDPGIGTVVSGVFVGTLCYTLAKLPRTPVLLRFRPMWALRVLAHIGGDLVTSSVRVAARSLWRPRQGRGVIVAVPARTESDILLAITAAVISLITGTLVVELNRAQGVLYVHGFPADTPDAIRRLRRQVWRIEELIVHAFGTAADLAAFQEAKAAEVASGEEKL